MRYGKQLLGVAPRRCSGQWAVIYIYIYIIFLDFDDGTHFLLFIPNQNSRFEYYNPNNYSNAYRFTRRCLVTCKIYFLTKSPRYHSGKI
jgi:Ca2+/H+ antiporter